VNRPGRMVHVLLLVIALCLAVNAVRPYVHPEQTALAYAGGFDYVEIVSPMFLYKGSQGVLVWDKRNGNVWFIGRDEDFKLSLKDPVLVVRLPLEKLTQAPQ